ncbi:toxin-antitoxin system YwqK family antitoxin [Flavobacteriales bacterium]|nr:toxin-antitoxin system YwqK family antitoxin [Flavobacteriales bacterium]|tara:strand:- start:500 stop:1708 length:1209 start_codon:yes stop_codon:yes gene_type:complete
MREYNYNKDEVIIETKRTDKGETYKVYYKNKKYFFGLFSQKGDKILDGIVLHYYISDDDPTHSRTTIKNGVRTKQEDWENGEIVKINLYNKEGVFHSQKKITSQPKKKTNIDDNESEIFNSLNKKLGTNFKQNDYTIPIDLVNKIDNLIYFKNQLYSGFITMEKFNDGTPKKIMEYKNGIQEGGFKEYWLNGKIKIDSNIKNKKIHGKNKEYFQNGNLQLEGNFNNGKENGLWKGYYEDGQKKIEEEYKNGINHGVYKKYHRNGELCQEVKFENGKEDGLYKEYFEDGTLFREILFKNGEEVVGPKEEDIIVEGEQKERFLDYHENGKLSSETEIKNGIPHGLGKSWDENGILNNEIIFENGIPIKSTWYHSNGTPKKEEFDEKGKIISKCWDEDGNEIKCE